MSQTVRGEADADGAATAAVVVPGRASLIGKSLVRGLITSAVVRYFPEFAKDPMANIAIDMAVVFALELVRGWISSTATMKTAAGAAIEAMNVAVAATELAKARRELSPADVARMAEVDIGVCASCGQESVLGVGEEKCRGCLVKQTRIPIGISESRVGPVGGGDAETKG